MSDTAECYGYDGIAFGIWKRAWWQFYNPDIRRKDEWHRLPRKITSTALTVDAPLKDKESSDNVAIQVWGLAGADSFLLDMRLAKMNYPTAKRQIKEMAHWSRKIWRVPQYVLIENGGFGAELIIDLKRELTGIVKITPGKDGDKVVRAESASDAIESGNCFLPGIGPPEHPSFNEAASPADTAAFVANCALFPNVTHDDDIDACSQFLNWRRTRITTPLRTSSAMRRVQTSTLPVRR